MPILSLPSPSERFPGRDGDRCEVCKGHAEEMHLKHIIIGHKACLERNDIDEDVVNQNIRAINRDEREKSEAA